MTLTSTLSEVTFLVVKLNKSNKRLFLEESRPWKKPKTFDVASIEGLKFQKLVRKKLLEKIFVFDSPCVFESYDDSFVDRESREGNET